MSNLMPKIQPGRWLKIMRRQPPFLYWQHAIVSDVSPHNHLPTQVIYFDSHQNQVCEVPLKTLLEPKGSAADVCFVDKTAPVSYSKVLDKAKAELGKGGYTSCFHFTESCFSVDENNPVALNKQETLTCMDVITSILLGGILGIAIGIVGATLISATDYLFRFFGGGWWW